MKNYLAIFIGNTNGGNFAKWTSMEPAKKKQVEQEGMMAWMAWGQKHEKSIVAMGGPLGKTKSIDPKGISDIKNMMTAYTVVRADSHEAAAKMFEGHPHFTIFPGDSIEVMEVMPIPTM